MATRVVSITGTLSNDAEFRAYVAMIHDSFIAFGWVQASDTGQIDPTTVARPGTANTDAGYMIWRMNDALQATSPFFCKVFFGVGSTTSTPRLKVEIATGTNGAGTLTGNISTQQTLGGSTGTASNSYFSGSSSRFQLAMWPSNGQLWRFLSIERDRNSSGVETGDGANILCYGNIAWVSQFIPKTTLGVPAPIETKVCTLISSQTSQSAGGNTGVGVVRPVMGVLRNPMIGWLICSRADFTSEVTNAISLYGVSRTYLALTSTALGTSVVGNNTAPGSLMLFE